MPVGAIADNAAIERFRHEHEIPLGRARAVDNIFPELRRQPLGEIAAQPVNAVVIVQDAVDVAHTGAVAHAVAGFLQPEFRISAHVVPQLFGVLRHGGIVVPIALIQVIAVVVGIVAYQRGVIAIEQLRRVEPLAEIAAVRRAGNVMLPARRPVVERGRLAIIRIVGKPAGAHTANGRGRALTRIHQLHPLAHLAKNRVPTGVIEHAIQHDVDGPHLRGAHVRTAPRIARRHELLELRQRRSRRLCAPEPLADREIILRRIRAARFAARRQTIFRGRVNRLKPQAIRLNLVKVFNAEFIKRAAIARTGVNEVGKRGATVFIRRRRLDAQGIQLINGLLQRLARRNHDRVIPNAAAGFGIVVPIRGAAELIARGQAIRAALRHVRFPHIAPRVGIPRHGMSRVITRGAGRHPIAAGRADGIRHAIAIQIGIPEIAPAHVRENLHICRPRRRNIHRAQVRRLAHPFINKELAGRVIGIHAVDRQGVGPLAHHAIFKHHIVRAVGLILRQPHHAIAAVGRRAPRRDLIAHDRVGSSRQSRISNGGHPPHGIALTARILLLVAEGHRHRIGQRRVRRANRGPGRQRTHALRRTRLCASRRHLVAHLRVIRPHGRAILIAHLHPHLQRIARQLHRIAAVPDKSRLCARIPAIGEIKRLRLRRAQLREHLARIARRVPPQIGRVVVAVRNRQHIFNRLGLGERVRRNHPAPILVVAVRRIIRQRHGAPRPAAAQAIIQHAAGLIAGIAARAAVLIAVVNRHRLIRVRVPRVAHVRPRRLGIRRHVPRIAQIGRAHRLERMRRRIRRLRILHVVRLRRRAQEGAIRAPVGIIHLQVVLQRLAQRHRIRGNRPHPILVVAVRRIVGQTVGRPSRRPGLFIEHPAARHVRAAHARLVIIAHVNIRIGARRRLERIPHRDRRRLFVRREMPAIAELRSRLPHQIRKIGAAADVGPQGAKIIIRRQHVDGHGAGQHIILHNRPAGLSGNRERRRRPRHHARRQRAAGKPIGGPAHIHLFAARSRAQLRRNRYRPGASRGAVVRHTANRHRKIRRLHDNIRAIPPPRIPLQPESIFPANKLRERQIAGAVAVPIDVPLPDCAVDNGIR